ncbi:MAG: GMC oxidoreductase, partial [Pseudomonadota bacterium]|nr:GMC oxidoreductase [Pseudomonadota bacterium]
AIRFKFLSDPIYRDVMTRGFRQNRAMMDTQAMRQVRGAEFSPGAEIETDDQILDYIRGNSETAYHPVGTCRMGQGPGAVVDARLRVHGLHGLRVADASIMPTMVSGNTNAACIMIGEKCADLLKEDHAAA